MSLLQCAGFAVLSAEIRVPRIGAATADLTVDTETDLSGALTITSADGAFALQGTAYRHGQVAQRQSIRWVAGADGLGATLPPAQFRGYTLRSVLTSTLTACGERLSAASDPSLLGSFLTNWVRLGWQTGKFALLALLAAKNAQAWRVLPDGSVWVAKSEPWPAAAQTAFQVLDVNPAEGWAIIGCEQPFIAPGTMLPVDSGDGVETQRRIGYVVHTIDPTSVRAKVYFEDSNPL